MIKLSKDLLKTEYIDNKLNSYKIAKKYNCTATWVNVLRGRYGIKTLKPYERNAKQKLSKRQQEYIYGTVLGDGSIKFDRQSVKNAFLSIWQSRKSYVKWQYSIMKDFVNREVRVFSYKQITRRNMYYFNTISHPIFTCIYREIYLNGIKTISSAWLNQLTPFSLTVWYMDDGSITQSNHQMRISTESFSYQEHLLVQRYLKKKWGILTDIKPSSAKNKFLLNFKAKERDKFFKLVRPYILPEMKYKIYNNEGKWKEWTASEIDYLKRNYWGWQTNWKEVLQTLNRSKLAIQRKASYLALARRSKV